MSRMDDILIPKVDVRRADERFKTRIGWLDSKHSFSFSQHYDPDNTHHGLLPVSNADVVSPRMGFEAHPQRDMESRSEGRRGGTGGGWQVRYGLTTQRYKKKK